MTEKNPASFLQLRTDHTAENDRLTIFGLIGEGGVGASTDLAVSANGSPNMSVNVAAGVAYIAATGGNHRGVYGVYNDGVVNKTISGAHATLARYDLVVARVRDAQYSGSNSDWLIDVVTGSPAASPVDPTPSFDNYILLARVQVDAAATQITSGKITDLREDVVLKKFRVSEFVKIEPLAATDGFRVLRFGDLSNYQHRFDGNGDAWIGRQKGTLTVGPDATADGTTSGIQAVYNRYLGASERSTISPSTTSYASGTPDCAVTFVAPPSGRITLQYYMIGEGGTSGERLYLTAEVREDNASGAVVSAAADSDSVQMDGATRKTAYGFHNVSGLTPGQTYYARTMHRTKDGTTSNIVARRLLVLPNM